MRAKRARKILGHGHLIKTTPIFLLSYSIALVAGTLTSAKPQASPQLV